MKHHRSKHRKAIIALLLSAVFIVFGIGIIWIATLQIPDLSAFAERKVAESTKIYDRTGQVLLYDVHENTKRTLVPFENISPDIKNATVAIEDTEFYQHFGIKPTAIIRAIIADLTPGGLKQGGSTITQQVIKNSVLTKDQTLTRKLKEWVLAIKLERMMSKDQILSTYLNETPYGGNIYGVEEASRVFFGKTSKDVTLAEAAYIAALPQAPSYYSPYGSHVDALTGRQRSVLKKMRENNFITEEKYQEAVAEKVVFLEKNTTNIRAPHFSLMVRDYLIDKYGEDLVLNGGLKVTTSLDFALQDRAEKVVSNFSKQLEESFGASNTAMVAIDPKSGDVLVMVGSRNYYDNKIDGNFNIATAHRQPGSTFKPFVYATAFMKGYTPETAIFDVPTEFSTACTVEGKPKNPNASSSVCYSPKDYDDVFEGPMTMRTALAHSRNVPAVKTLYLAGIKDSIQTAENMGINGLNDPDRYGLTLVLGGGEVSLLDITSAYGVFANDGVRNPYRTILKVEDGKGNVLEEAVDSATQAIPAQAARQISDILSDRKVRMESLSGLIDPMRRQVAIKTGTTNDYRDVWVEGYTPSLVVGAWAGKNDNTPMSKKVAGLVIAPVWAAFMSEVIQSAPQYVPESETFKTPEPVAFDAKPTLRGIWNGGVSYFRDKVSGKVATDYTPPETQEEIVFNSVHSLLYWIDKDNPTGPKPAHPENDSQFAYWEYGVRTWFDNWRKNHPEFVESSSATIPTDTDTVHTAENIPKITIASPEEGAVLEAHSRTEINFSISGKYPTSKVEIYINGKYITSDTTAPFTVGFTPSDIQNLNDSNQLKLVVYDSVSNKAEATINFAVQK